MLRLKDLKDYFLNLWSGLASLGRNKSEVGRLIVYWQRDPYPHQDLNPDPKLTSVINGRQPMDVLFLDLYLRLPFPYGLVPNRQGNPAPVRYRTPPLAPEKRLLKKPTGPWNQWANPRMDPRWVVRQDAMSTILLNGENSSWAGVMSCPECRKEESWAHTVSGLHQ